MADNKTVKNITQLAPFAKDSTISRALGIPYGVVRYWTVKLEKQGKINKDTGIRLNEEQCVAFLEEGTVPTSIRFFSSNHGNEWTVVEDDFIRDNAGVYSDYELGHWLGRTERAAEKRRLQLGLDHFEESGYFSSQQVMECLGLRPYQLSRLKSKGLISPIDDNPVRKDVECNVGKLRYSLKELTKNGKEVPVHMFGTLFKGRKFLKDYYTPEAVTEFIQTYRKGRSHPCMSCGKNTLDGSMCATCV